MNVIQKLEERAATLREVGLDEKADGVAMAIKVIRESGLIVEASAQAHPERNNTRYTPEEDDLIRAEWTKGTSISDIATKLGRVHGAVYKHARHFLLLPSRPGDRSIPPPNLPLIPGGQNG